MSREEIIQHRARILDLINRCIIETGRLEPNEFNENEQLKERVHSQLQQVGQAAFEVKQILEAEDHRGFDKGIYDKLSTLRNARFHQETERTVPGNIWPILRQDLPEMEDAMKEEKIE